MEKQLKEFKALLPSNIKGLMIQFWMKDERIPREEALKYITPDFETFAKSIANTAQTFKPDLGYSNKDYDGVLCFVKGDDNWVIPVEILEHI